MRQLHVGQPVRLSGILYTARDAAHKYLAGITSDRLPPTLQLAGGVLYHCGPVMVQDDTAEKWHITAAGPTTSAR
ncbi:MAG: fumarate hydratase C-terminal domain-containing protein, partial [Victivallales bacterium]|nr:fumarate hydratase C-terminal domain-containing protein [Victivallales bacterium]